MVNITKNSCYHRTIIYVLPLPPPFLRILCFTHFLFSSIAYAFSFTFILLTILYTYRSRSLRCVLCYGTRGALISWLAKIKQAKKINDFYIFNMTWNIVANNILKEDCKHWHIIYNNNNKHVTLNFFIRCTTLLPPLFPKI